MITGCKSRFESVCPICAKRWKRKVSGHILDGIMSMKQPSFMTLTLTKRRSGLHRMKSLWSLRNDLFRRLRDGGYNIGSWVAVVEYPNHLHICMDSEYIPQREISKAWKSITGDSYIVDIRRIGNRASPAVVAKYLSKYLGKSTGWPSEVVQELKSFRVVQSYGLPKVERHWLKCPHCGEVGGFAWTTDEDFLRLDESSKKYGEGPPRCQCLGAP